jgi:mycothione reductase
MLVHTADVARTVRHAGRFGIGAKWAGAEWPAICDRVFGRIDPLHERAVAYRRAGGIDVFTGEARFTGPKVLRVGGDEIQADQFVLAAGSRPAIPAVPGLAGVPYLTSDTLMRLGRLPRSMAVLGGGYIAAEMSHIFGSLGTEVTIVARGQCLLLRYDTDIRARFTELYQRRFDIRPGTTAEQVSATRKGVRLSLAFAAGAQAAEGEVLLVATGRIPNSDRLDVAAARIEVDARDAAYGWALEDTTSFVKVLADPATRLLLGAHIIGPQASTLIQPLIQAMFLGNTADQIAAGVLYIHPALTEAVELACSSCETSSPRGWCREALREADGRERRRTAMARATWPGVVLAETSHPVLLEGNVHFPLGDVRTAQAQEAPEALISEGPEAACEPGIRRALRADRGRGL